uniref:WRKY transcription factor n=2 Tax=Solanum tuberosum TaxID=4113 RepID=M1BHN9_SOLTU
MSILTTTYEGTHNHPLPFSATAMASTTSAAASMLRCTSTSSTSQQFLPNIDQNLHGKFNFTNNNLLLATHNNAPTFHHLPKTSISTSQSHPTITLDFTTNSSSTNFSSSSFNSYSTLCNNFKSEIGPSSYLGRPCYSNQPFITSKNNQNTINE